MKAHYYEIHVTVEGLDPATAVGFVNTEEQWWPSQFDREDFDNDIPSLVYTTRAASFQDAVSMMKRFNDYVRDWSGKVVRSKVEAVVFDTKSGDTL